MSVLAGWELITGLRSTAAENVSGYCPMTIEIIARVGGAVREKLGSEDSLSSMLVSLTMRG
jgi:hypothetical protein